MNTTNRAAIYTRISSDPEGREAGVTRQEADCRALAERLGLDVVMVLTDNDVGASSRSKGARPGYERLLDGARLGAWDTILAYSNSRLTRRPREWEDLIDLAQNAGVRVRTVASGDHDFNTADGRAVARTIAAWDSAEAERTGERTRRAFDARAAAGKRHGAPPYGWRRNPVTGEDELQPHQAQVIRDCTRRVLAGESLRALARELREAGEPTPGKGSWSGPSLRQLLARASNAGRRRHRGEVIGKGAWPAILDDDTYDRLMALLDAPNRTNAGPGRPPRYLLSGIAICGRCGAPMRGQVGARNAPKHQPTAYCCSGCTRVRRNLARVDEYVEGVIVARLAMPDGPALAAGDAAGYREAGERLEAVRARLAEAADRYADGTITGEQLARITARLRPDEAEAEQALAAARPADELGDLLASGDPAGAWDEASLDVKRAVVRLLLRVTILPVGPGGAFDPDGVRLEWLADG